MRSRGTKQAIASFLLVTSCFLVLWLYLRAGSTTQKQSYMSSSHIAHTGPKSSPSKSLFGFRHWRKIGPAVDPRVSVHSSPYYIHNRRRRQVRSHPNNGQKLILWMAQKTLKITQETASVFRWCPVSNCKVAPSKTFNDEKVSAVVYDDISMAKNLPLPVKEGRVLVYYSMRTPNDVISDEDHIHPTQNVSWKSAINWVWSFRPDSDIFEPFGYFKASEEGIGKDLDMIMGKKTSVALWITPQVKPGHRTAGDKSLHEGPSHTGVEAYLEDMKGKLVYDTMTLTELREALSHKSFSLSKYFFIFAFEWVDCPDYLSDLYFLSLDPRIHAMPVVRGGFPYEKYLPKDTFINAANFEGPRELATHLMKLAGKTNKEYQEMIKKKCKYGWEEGIKHAWCQLCNMVHYAEEDRNLLMDRIDDVYAWSVEGGRCKAGDAYERKNRAKMAEKKVQEANSNAPKRPIWAY